MSRSFEELSVVERLAFEQAVFKVVAENVSAKNPDSLRSYADEEIVGNYRATGAKSYDVRVNGEKVGTYSVRVSKGRPEQVENRLAVRDPYAFDRYVRESATDEAMEYIHLMQDNFAAFLLNTYGVVPDGCEMVEERTPAQPSQVTGTTLRIDERRVFKAFGNELPTAMAGLLGGGEDA